MGSPQATTGSVVPGKWAAQSGVLVGEPAAWLRERIAGADFTLRGLQAELAERNVRTAYKAVWRFVHAEKLKYQKSVLPAEQDCADVARKRARWKTPARVRRHKAACFL